MAIWILTEEFNAYDQYGEYFRALWDHKPTQTEVVQALVELNKPSSLSVHMAMSEHHLPQLLADADHILTGGGRRETEETWYNLREEPPRKLWGHK